MKESKILKYLCYTIIPILILILIISFFYEFGKENIDFQENKENYFESDIFLGDYMGILCSQTSNLIYNHNRYTSIKDGDYEICYQYNKNDGIYSYISNEEIKDLFYIILYKNYAITNVELTSETNTIEKIKTYIENQNSKKVNIINGEIFSDSEIIKNKAIQYFNDFDNTYYNIIENNRNDVLDTSESTENFEISETPENSTYREYHNVSITDFQIYSCYKEEIIEKNSNKIFYDVINYLKNYENIIIYATPIVSILLCIIFIYLIISIGHTKGKEGIDLNDFDKIPLEIILIIVISIICLIVFCQNIFLDSINYDNYKFLISLILTGYFISSILIILSVVTIIKRIKAKTIIKESLSGKLFKWIFNICKKVLNKIKEIWKEIKKVLKKLNDQLSLTVKFALFIIIYCIISLFFIIAFEVVGFIIVLIYTGIILYEVLDIIISYKKIEEHLKNMYNGNHLKKLDSNDYNKVFKNIVKYINDISIGFENAIQEGIKSERLKTELITNVSHDIKTPLTSIINYVDLLKKEDIQNDKAKEYIEVLDNKSQRLKKLTEDLLEASKASSGNVKLNIEKININELINQTTGEFEDRFKGKNLDIILSIPKEDIFINADNRYMYRIIENLFSNISKYALENSRVYIDVKKEFGRVKIDIKNISKEKLNISADELIQRFVRGDKSRTTEGSGLGISISKSLTEIQKGLFELQIDGDLFKVHLEFDIVNM